MSRIDLYATRSDWLGALADAEAQCELQYVRVGDQDAAEPSVFNRAAGIPDLGVAKDGWVLREDRWYVLDRSARVVVDEVQRLGRSSRYFVGARLNPDAVLIVPGGRLGERGVVQGTLNPVSPSEKALAVFRCLEKAVQRSFMDAGGVLIGPEALLLYRNGVRLAPSLHSPPESDFKLERTEQRDATR